MIGLKNAAAALALSLAVVAAASPASAAHKHVSHQARAARAQAASEGEVGNMNGGVVMNKAREDAIRECSGQMNRLVQKDWGVMQDEMYSSCMVQHGQPQ